MKGLLRILLAIAAVAFSATLFGEEGGRIYVYHDYFAYPSDPTMPSLPIVINEKERTVYSGHTGYRAELCPDDDKFICVESASFTFAVPRKLESTEWTHNGREYELIGGLRSKEFLGTAVSYYQIEHERDDDYVDQYLFSPARGLIAISVRAKDEASPGWFWWSAKSCGFGATSCLPDE